MNALPDNDIQLKLLKLLGEEPKLTQREMNKKMGVSLGKINYCISALAEKGMIKIERFKNNSNKISYLYRLTPDGMDELARLTIDFLKLKIDEYDQIKQEIRVLSAQINEMDPNLYENSELISEAKKRI